MAKAKKKASSKLKWLRISAADVTPSARSRPALGPFDWGKASEGEQRLLRFLTARAQGKAPSPADVEAICEAFALIISGEDPAVALRLQRPKTGRARRDPFLVISIGQQIDALRAQGSTVTAAMERVARDRSMSVDSVKDYWKDRERMRKVAAALEVRKP